MAAFSMKSEGILVRKWQEKQRAQNSFLMSPRALDKKNILAEQTRTNGTCYLTVMIEVRYCILMNKIGVPIKCNKTLFGLKREKYR